MDTARESPYDQTANVFAIPGSSGSYVHIYMVVYLKLQPTWVIGNASYVYILKWRSSSKLSEVLNISHNEKQNPCAIFIARFGTVIAIWARLICYEFMTIIHAKLIGTKISVRRLLFHAYIRSLFIWIKDTTVPFIITMLRI